MLAMVSNITIPPTIINRVITGASSLIISYIEITASNWRITLWIGPDVKRTLIPAPQEGRRMPKNLLEHHGRPPEQEARGRSTERRNEKTIHGSFILGRHWDHGIEASRESHMT